MHRLPSTLPIKIILILLGFFSSSSSFLKAGSVFFLADTPRVDGKLALNSSAIHVEGSSAPEISLPGVLEADFDDSDFHLDSFSSSGANSLPANWKAQDNGEVYFPGSVTVADGVFKLSGSGSDVHDVDRSFFAAQSWTGDGQWTVHVEAMDERNEGTEAGLMLRDSFDSGSPTFALGIFGKDKGLFHYRDKLGDHFWGESSYSADPPAWLRLTRSGQSITGTLSHDGKNWENIGQFYITLSSHFCVGLFVNSRSIKSVGEVSLDQVTFKPRLVEPGTISGGVLLRSGSFIAGSLNHFDNGGGKFDHQGKAIPLTLAQVAAVAWHPVTLRQLMEYAPQTGLILKNGDFFASDFGFIEGAGAHMNSLLLGIVDYNEGLASACLLQAPQPQPSQYEIRLKDGSILRANSLSMNKGQLAIDEISGLSIPIDPADVAQFRAGPARVQNLFDLPWKSTPAAGQSPPPVEGWAGNSQEQILVAPAGTTVDFPLTGKFQALAMRVALAPDAPANSNATVRIMADGKEVSRTPPFHAGEQPRFVQVALHNPKTLTLVADTVFAGARVLYIDPVAIRESSK